MCVACDLVRGVATHDAISSVSQSAGARAQGLVARVSRDSRRRLGIVLKGTWGQPHKARRLSVRIAIKESVAAYSDAKNRPC